jgi:hypothetical protein
MKKLQPSILLLTIILCVFALIYQPSFGLAQNSQSPQTKWTMSYNALSGSSVIQADDLGYIVLGSATIYSDNEAGALLKVDAQGNQVWLKNTASFGYNLLLAKATEGSFAVATTTTRTVSYGSDRTYNVYDFSLTKFDSNGNKLWNRTYDNGPLSSTSLATFEATADGGFVLGGYANVYDPSGYSSFRSDIFLLRTDSNGNPLWNRTYGGSEDDAVKAVVQTVDGGFAITAFSGSFKESQSTWLIKTDPEGAIQWNNIYSYFDLALSPSAIYPNGGFPTSDKGYLLFGYSSSYQSGSYQSTGLVFKTDSKGNIQWTQTLNSSVKSAVQTSDGGYAITVDGPGGTTILIRTDGLGTEQWNTTCPAYTENFGSPLIQSKDGGIVLTGKSANKLWLLKTEPVPATPPLALPSPKSINTANASSVWQRYFDGVDGYSVVPTSDSGFALVGETAVLQSSNPGQQYINYSSVIIKTDSSGNPVFRRDLPIGNMINQDNSSFQTIIRSVDVVLTFIVQTGDGGYTLAGTTTLYRNSGTYSNYCMAKTDSQGNILWVQQYNFGDELSAFAPAADGGYFLAGRALATHLLKTDETGKIEWSKDLPIRFATQIISTSDGGCTVLGSTYAYSSGGSYSGSSVILHLGSDGNVTWTNSLSGFLPSTGLQTNDGGYLVVGLSNPHTYLSSSVLLKLDNLGNMSWFKLYDTQPFYYPKSLITCREGGFMFAATTPDQRVLIKIDESGVVEKVVTLDTMWTSYSKDALHVIQASDGNYVIASKYTGLNTTEYNQILLTKISLQTSRPNPSPSVPEFQTRIILPALAIAMLIFAAIKRRINLGKF